MEKGDVESAKCAYTPRRKTSTHVRDVVWDGGEKMKVLSDSLVSEGLIQERIKTSSSEFKTHGGRV